MAWGTTDSLRRNNLDLMRLILASGVLLNHSYAACGDRTPGPVLQLTDGTFNLGQLCVFGFFSISGYLISASGDRCHSVWQFLWHRVLRIYPAFFAVTLITDAVVVPLGGGVSAEFSTRIVHIFKDTLLLSSRDVPGAFAGNPEPSSYNVSLWTIPFEMRCYLVVPLVGLLGFGFKKLSAVIVCLLFVGTTLFESPFNATRYAKWWNLIAMPLDFWYPLALAFTGGMIFYRFQASIRYSHAAGVLAIFGTLFCLSQPSLRYLGTAVCGTYAVMYLAFHNRTICPNLAKKYGDMSYGAYLYGFPIQQLLVHYFGSGITPLGLFAMALPLSLIAGATSWHLVEKRCLRYKDSLFSRRNTTASN